MTKQMKDFEKFTSHKEIVKPYVDMLRVHLKVNNQGEICVLKESLDLLDVRIATNKLNALMVKFGINHELIESMLKE